MDTMTKKRIVINMEENVPFVIDVDHYLIGRVDDKGRMLCIPSMADMDDWRNSMILIGESVEATPDEWATREEPVFDVCITDFQTGRQREFRTRGLAMVAINECEGFQAINHFMLGLSKADYRKFHRLVQKVYEDSKASDDTHSRQEGEW